MKVLLVICASALCMVSAFNNEYCKIDCQGRPHIGCNNNGAFSQKCNPKAEIINLTGELKGKFIDLHNELREKIASGKLENYKPAAQMGSVTWDEELAKLAVLNVKQCQMKHDRCRSTKNYKYAGQNLAMSGNLPAISPKAAIEKAVNGWYAEYPDADMSVIDEFHANGKKNGHFTAMVNEKNSRIGCAVLRTPYGRMTAYFTACNYARNNMIGEPIYKSGKPASGCQSGRNSRYPSLCNSSEKYDV